MGNSFNNNKKNPISYLFSVHMKIINYRAWENPVDFIPLMCFFCEEFSKYFGHHSRVKRT